MYVEIKVEDEFKNIFEESLNGKLTKWFVNHKPSRDCAIDLMNILQNENLEVGEFYICDYMEINGKNEKCLHKSSDMLQKENERLRNQLKAILKLVREKKSFNMKLVLEQFPLMNEDSLRQLNMEIKAGDKNLYIEAIKSILKPGGGAVRNLRYIFSDDIFTSFNIKGVFGKKSFLQYRHFYSALLDSIPFEGTGFTPEDLLRRAIRSQKSRIRDSKCRSSKSAIYTYSDSSRSTLTSD